MPQSSIDAIEPLPTKAIAIKNKLVQLFGNQPQDCWCSQCKAETNWENEDLYYKCIGCDRIVPYCFGQADQYFDYCDDCADYLNNQPEDRQKMCEKPSLPSFLGN